LRGRWTGNTGLAKHFNVTRQTIHRWKRDEKKKTPKSPVIGGRELNDLDAWDAWAKTHIPSDETTDADAA
jgi:hypothetical protein